MKWAAIAAIVIAGLIVTTEAQAGGQCFVQQGFVQQGFAQPVFVQRQRFIGSPFVQQRFIGQPVFVQQPGFNFSFGRVGGQRFRSFSFGF